jgi:hypothetical protein
VLYYSISIGWAKDVVRSFFAEHAWFTIELGEIVGHVNGGRGGGDSRGSVNMFGFFRGFNFM